MMNQEHDSEIEEEIKKLSLTSNSEGEEEMVKLTSSPFSSLTAVDNVVGNDVQEQFNGLKNKEIDDEKISTDVKENDAVSLKETVPLKAAKPLQNASSLFKGESTDLFATSLTPNSEIPSAFGPSQQLPTTSPQNTESVKKHHETFNHFSYSPPKINNHVPSFSNIQPNNIHNSIPSLMSADPAGGSMQSYKPHTNGAGPVMSSIPKQNINNNPPLQTSSVFAFNPVGQNHLSQTSGALPTGINQQNQQITNSPLNNFNQMNRNLESVPTAIKPHVTSPSGPYIPSMYSPNKTAAPPSTSPSLQYEFFIPSQPSNGTSQSTVMNASYPSSEHDHGQSLYSNVGLEHNSTLNNNEQGFWQWIKNAVNGNLKQQLKHATDSVLTTLDPGMEDYLHSSNISIGIASQDISILHGMRQAFSEVFGNIDIKEQGCSPNNVPHGFDAVVSSIDHHLLSSCHMNFGSSSNALVSCMVFMTETTTGRLAIVMCLGLKDGNRDSVFHSFSQPIPIPSEKEAMFKENHNMQQMLDSQGDWCNAFTGGYRKFQLVYSTALCLAYQYKSFLKEQKSAVQQSQQMMNYQQHLNSHNQMQQQHQQQFYGPHQTLHSLAASSSSYQTPTQLPPLSYQTPTQPPPSSYRTPTQPPLSSYRTPTQPPPSNYQIPIQPLPSSYRTPTQLPPSSYQTPSQLPPSSYQQPDYQLPQSPSQEKDHQQQQQLQQQQNHQEISFGQL